MNMFILNRTFLPPAILMYFGMIMLLGVSTTLYAKKGDGDNGKRNLQKTAVFDTKNHDVNRLFLPISNESTFGQNIANGSAGTFWPYPATNDAYIFGAGIWVGALVETGVDANGEPILKPLVSVGYNPNSGDSEMTPGGLPLDPDDQDYRVLMSTDLGGADAGLFPSSTDDLWPFRDSNGNPFSISDQDSWCQYNDFGISEHVDDFSTDGIPIEERPLGIVITQTGFAYTIPAYRDIVFMTYDITNRTRDLTNSDGSPRFPDGAVLRDVYLGVVCDPDIGDAADDQISYFKGEYTAPGETEPLELNLGINYDDDGTEASFQNPNAVGVVGYNFMESPAATRDVFIDPLQTIEIKEGEPLGMTSLKQFTLETDPRDDGERYFAMRGFDHISGEYARFDSTTVAADQRFIQNTGPFDIPVDSTVRVVVAVLAAKDRQELLQVAYNAQKAYNLDFILPAPPPSPKLSLIPDNKKVTVVWDNSPETASDPFFPFRGSDTTYLEFDFEGYRVYRSADGSNWTLIDSADVINGDTLARGNDGGLHYSYVDTDNLINGYPYFYAVTSYDYNSTPATLESGLSLNAQQISPRSEAANYVPPKINDAEQTNPVADNVLEVTANILFPFDVQANIYTLTIDDVLVVDPAVTQKEPIYKYTISGGGETLTGDLLASVNDAGDGYVINTQKSGIINGVELEFNGAASWNSFVVESVTDGNSSDVVDGVTPEADLPYREFFSGNNLEIQWRELYAGTDSSTFTVEIRDLFNDIQVPFKPVRSANGWGFINDHPVFGDPDMLFETVPDVNPPLFFRGLYVNGIKIGSIDKDALVDGAVWQVNISSQCDRLPSIGDQYSLNFEAAAEFTSENASLDNVRVVPDPYLIRNEWEGGYEFQRLSFTNLPDQCTIRIFTVSGELVKTLEHNNTSGNSVENDQGGAAYWDLITNSERQIASGVYIYHIESSVGEKVGRFAVIR